MEIWWNLVEIDKFPWNLNKELLILTSTMFTTNFQTNSIHCYPIIEQNLFSFSFCACANKISFSQDFSFLYFISQTQESLSSFSVLPSSNKIKNHWPASACVRTRKELFAVLCAAPDWSGTKVLNQTAIPYQQQSRSLYTKINFLSFSLLN